MSPPHVIFQHEDDRLGPAEHDEWQAFIKDSEGNTVGLIAFQRPSSSKPPALATASVERWMPSSIPFALRDLCARGGLGT